MAENKKILKQVIQKLWAQHYTDQPREEAMASWQRFRQQHIQSRPANRVRHLYAATGIAAALILVVWGVFYFSNNLDRNTIVNNPTLKVKQVTLPDGTLVTLYKGSSISYQEAFKNNREVIFKGTGYFQVAKDKLHPFKILANGTETTVKGTIFRLSTDKKDVVLNLYEGSVELNYTKKRTKWRLKPGQKISMDGNTAKVGAFQNVFYKTVAENYIDIDNVKFSDFTAYLENRYGYAIVPGPRFADETITIRINNNDSLENIIKLISTIYQAKPTVDEENKTITLE